MALKKISNKKMVEALWEVNEEINKGDLSRILETLEKYKIDLHTVDPGGCTFLWDVGTGLHIYNPPELNRNIIACMQFLIDHGADVNHQVTTGETVLFLVVGLSRSNPEAAEMLIRNGADVNILDNTGGSALIRAICGFEDGKPEAITTLLKAGADPYLKLDSEKFGYDTLLEIVEEKPRAKQTQLKATFFKAMKDLGLLKE